MRKLVGRGLGELERARGREGLVRVEVEGLGPVRFLLGPRELERWTATRAAGRLRGG